MLLGGYGLNYIREHPDTQRRGLIKFYAVCNDVEFSTSDGFILQAPRQWKWELQMIPYGQ